MQQQAAFSALLQKIRILQVIKRRMEGVGPQLRRIMGHVLKTVRIKESHPRPRVQLLHLHGAVVVEGGVDDLSFHPHFQFKAVQPFLNFRIKNDPGLNLHIDFQPGGLHKLIDLRQSGDCGIRIFRMGPVEFHFLQLGKGMVHHPSMSVAGPVDGFIVNHHQLSVLCHLHIQFHAVRLLIDGKLKCLQRIFRRVSAGAPVRPYFCFHRFPALLPP